MRNLLSDFNQNERRKIQKMQFIKYSRYSLQALEDIVTI